MRSKEELIQFLRSKMDSEGCFIRDDGVSPLGDNKIIMVALFYMMLKLLGYLTNADKVEYKRVIKSLWARISTGEQVQGLYTRQPNQHFLDGDKNHKEIDQHDNGFAISGLDRVAAMCIAIYGYFQCWYPTFFWAMSIMGITYLCDYKRVWLICFMIMPLAHYDVRPWSYLRRALNMTRWEAIKEWIRCTRQPYQLGAYSLCGFGICDGISYVHLIIVVIIEFFNSIEKKSSGKILLWLVSQTMWGLGWIPALIFKLGQRIRFGKRYFQKCMKTYYGGNKDNKVMYALYELSEYL